MKRLYGAIAAVALLSAGGAGAVAKGGSLYIKSKDVKLLKEPKAGAAAVKPLAIGTEVKWQGASAADKAFHEVEVDGKKGFVLMSNLSPSKPQTEIAGSSGTPMSPQAFASSGAATKALTPAGINYAKSEGKDAPKALEAAAEIIHVEEYNKAKGTPEAIAAKAKSLGGGK
jgi:hypothetical protein